MFIFEYLFLLVEFFFEDLFVAGLLKNIEFYAWMKNVRSSELWPVCDEKNIYVYLWLMAKHIHL